jgi:nicotinate-nucleotide pyrophosphorylase (carboxylating)
MSRFAAGTSSALRSAGLDPAVVEAVVVRALDEDLACGPDLTTQATVPRSALGIGYVRPRLDGVLAGLPVATAVVDAVSDGEVRVEARCQDGDRVRAGQDALILQGPLGHVMAAERTMLNFLGHLSGIATLTRAWVDAIAGTGAQIRDTRKTLPGLRSLQKYAVRCGGGSNHRMGLGDQILIKDNHVVAAGGITAAFKAAADLAPQVPIEVECDTVDQVGEAIAAGATAILLDNMSLDEVRAAVRLARAATRRIVVEASGGISLDNAASVAAGGVDYLAIGALTHSAPALDVGLDLGPSI